MASIVKEQGSTDKAGYAKVVDDLKYGEDGESEQWLQVLELRQLLKQYSKTAYYKADSPLHADIRSDDALLAMRQTTALPAASAGNLGTLQAWLKDREGGNHFLRSGEGEVWQEYASDLVSLSEKEANQDFVSRWILDKFIPWFHSVARDGRDVRCLTLQNPAFGPESFETNLAVYQSDTVVAVINFTTTLVAGILPVAAIFTLYYVHLPLARMLVISAFTIVFGLVFTVMTNARRSEYFVATAALGAMMVVFVGSPDATVCSGRSG